MNGRFTKEQIQRDKKPYEQMFIFPAVRETQIQVQCCHLCLSNGQELKRIIMPTADSDMEMKDSHAGGNMNLVDLLESDLRTSVKT